MWPFNKKEEPIYVLTKDYEGKYYLVLEQNYDNTYGEKLAWSSDFNTIRSLYVSLSQQANIAEDIKKSIIDSMPKGYVDRITIGNHHYISNDSIISSTIPTKEDIKNMIEDPNIFYAVQGHYPNITVSKYEKVAEDSFNLCLRQETGNLSLLPKSICFNSKADAVIYQNKLIQEYSQVKNQNFPGKTTFEFEVEK